MPGVGRTQARRIGVHRHDALAHRFRRIAKVDAIAERLRHFRAAVRSGQTRNFADQRLGLDQHAIVQAIEAAHDFARLLDHRQLVLADRHQVRLENRDVRRLRDRVRVETDRQTFGEIFLFDFLLERRITFECRDRNQVHEVDRELGQLRNHRLHHDLDLLGIETDGEIIERDFKDVGLKLLGMLEVIGQRLHVGDQDVGLIFVLQAYAILQRADIVPEVQRAGRTIAGENSLAGHELNSERSVARFSTSSFMSGPLGVSRHIGIPKNRLSLSRRRNASRPMNPWPIC